jgi:hypothetical protein
MRYFNTFALGLASAAVASASDVADLTGETFPAFVKENPLVLAEFFAVSHPFRIHGRKLTFSAMVRTLQSSCSRV